MAQLKLELLKEEAKDLAEGVTRYSVSPGAFFRKALEVEERRYVSVSHRFLSAHS